MKDWKADVVLHDGAPNVGTAWVQDAYAQNELTLQSLRLAVEFLVPGGAFVTKVFRSKDYNNLMWVFQQLFHHVEATKPPSSRNVSAEIFVVCQRFKNLARIDPKFLDPRYVFKELDPTGKDMLGSSSRNLLENVVNPEKSRRKRDGYEDGNYTLYKTISADDYIRADDAVAVLGTYNRITFDSDADKAHLKHPSTTDDVKANCEDLKVLGRRDFSVLMKWRKMIRESLELDKLPVKDNATNVTVEMEPMNEEDAIDEELARLNEVASKRARKERRRRNEARAKAVQKLQLNMTTPMDLGEEWQDRALEGEDMFSLDAVDNARHRDSTTLLDADEAPSSDDEDDGETPEDDSEEDLDDRERRLNELESGMDHMYQQYQEHLQRRDSKHLAKEARRKSSKYEEWNGISSKPEGASDESDDENVAKGFDAAIKRKFHEETYDSDDAEDDEIEREELQESVASRQKVRPSTDPNDDVYAAVDSSRVPKQSAASAMWFDNPIFQDMVPLESLAPKPKASVQVPTPVEDNDEEKEEEDDMELVPSNQLDTIPEQEWSVHDEDQVAKNQTKVKDYGLQTAEAVSMAHALVNRQMTKTDLVNQGFNRHSFNDKSGLPEWFLEDENKHYRSNMPLSKEAVEALRARQRALDARPIKKVAEAKARKKHRAALRLERAQKKADAINENADLTEREKAENISKIMARSGKKTQKQAPQLVVARGPNRGIKGRPTGTKGRYRMVDRRMKKELRAQKRIDKRDGKKRSSSHHKRQIPKGY